MEKFEKENNQTVKKKFQTPKKCNFHSVTFRFIFVFSFFASKCVVLILFFYLTNQKKGSYSVFKIIITIIIIIIITIIVITIII